MKIKIFFYMILLLCVSHACNFIEEYEWKNSIKKGNIKYTEQLYEAAADHFKYALMLDSSKWRVQGNLGNAYYQNKEYNKAKQHYKTQLVYAKAPQDIANIHYHLGNVFFQEGNYMEALEEYNECLEQVADSSCMYNQKIVLAVLETQEKPNEQKDNKEREEPTNQTQLSNHVKQTKKIIDSLVREGSYIEAQKKIRDLVRKDPIAKDSFYDYMKKLERIIEIDTTYTADNGEYDKNG